LALHFYDFGFQKWFIYVDASPLNETRYFHELVEKFESPIRTDYIPYHFIIIIALMARV
jgi:succinate dehydrogenase / fumarate reductase cytochrome b subunit